MVGDVMLECRLVPQPCHVVLLTSTGRDQACEDLEFHRLATPLTVSNMF